MGVASEDLGLRQLGLVHTASELNDFIARATQKRWSPIVQLERLVQAEFEARLRQRVERRLKPTGNGSGRKPFIDRPSNACCVSRSNLRPSLLAIDEVG